MAYDSTTTPAEKQQDALILSVETVLEIARGESIDHAALKLAMATSLAMAEAAAAS